jgi:hypothetical protein
LGAFHFSGRYLHSNRHGDAASTEHGDAASTEHEKIRKLGIPMPGWGLRAACPPGVRPIDHPTEPLYQLALLYFCADLAQRIFSL